MNKKDIPHKSTKDKILDVAIELFSKKGFYAVSVREITRNVGIKESSLYNYFNSKNEVLDEILNIYQKELDDLFRQNRRAEPFDVLSGSPTAEEYLRGSMERFIKFWDSPRRERLWLIVSMEQHRNRRAALIILEDTQRRLADLEMIFQEFNEKKMIESTDPKMLAAEFFYAARAIHLEYRLLKVTQKSPKDINQKVFDFIHFFLNR